MRVEIILTGKEIDEFYLPGKTAIVIDTLRATSTIVTALYNGARVVEPMMGIYEARQRSQDLEIGTYLLCGEREGVKISGFDLGNSPLEYQPDVVSGKRVICSTTNGTMTIQKVSKAKFVLISSFLNQAATMDEVIRLGQDLILCCSGTKGHFSLEDFVTAGAMVSELNARGVKIYGDDRIQTARLLYERYKDDLVELMSCSQNGSRLVEIGNYRDIKFCAQRNIYPLVCYFTGQIICV